MCAQYVTEPEWSLIFLLKLLMGTLLKHLPSSTRCRGEQNLKTTPSPDPDLITTSTQDVTFPSFSKQREGNDASNLASFEDLFT